MKIDYRDITHGEVLTLSGGYSMRVSTERDDCMREPWKEHDGHGPVSDWTIRVKAPGERVLCEDRNHKRYYDFAAACRIALRDGWGYPGQYEYPKRGRPRMTAEALKLSKRERAARAAEADYERLRAWCADEWCWITVRTEVFYKGAPIADDHLGGIESDGDYWREHAAEHAAWEIKQHKAERKEARYWREREVLTIGA